MKPKMILTDLDGTLLCSDGSNQNAKLKNYLVNKT